MKNLLLILCALTYGLSAFAQESSTCRVQTAEKIYHFGDKTPEELDLWKSSDCSEDFKVKLRDFLLSSSGPITAGQLERILSESINTSFTISPEKLRVFNLQQRMHRRFGLTSDQLLKNFRLIDKGHLLLSNDEFLDFNCSKCSSTGEKSIELNISNSSIGSKKVRWLKALSVVKTEALAPKNSLRVNHKGLTPNDFQTIDVETQDPEELFTESKDLIFYRLNKPLDSGTPLTHQDVAPLNLVKVGTPVKIILKNKNLSLSYRAKALRGGKLGESVKLKTQNSNKVITGKVIDFNKVEIKL